MRSRRNTVHSMSWPLGFTALLLLSVLAPLLGGFMQQQHRMVRQSNLRRNRSEGAAIRLVLTESAAEKCYRQDKHELLYEGLQYDVLGMQRQGDLISFQVVPDLKETLISSLTLKSILFPAGEAVQKSAWAGVYFVWFDPADLPVFWAVSGHKKGVFAEQSAVEMAGFEWCFVPPPDLDRY